MTPVIKAARKNHNALTSEVRYLTLDSTKNHLKLKLSTTITLDEAR